jgi:hypothetical protein
MSFINKFSMKKLLLVLFLLAIPFSSQARIVVPTSGGTQHCTSLPPGPPPSIMGGSLGIGSRGVYVGFIQELLKSAGYPVPKTEYLGEQTWAALFHWAQSNGFQEDNLGTIAELLIDQNPCPTVPPPPNPIPYGITVTKPNTGGTFTRNTQTSIMWTTTGSNMMGATVEVSLIGPTPAITNHIISAQVPYASPFTWTVGKKLDGTTVPNGTYFVKACLFISGNLRICDQSDQMITIAGVEGIHVISPNGGETFSKLGSTHVKWEGATTEFVDLYVDFTKANGESVRSRLELNDIPNNGDYVWHEIELTWDQDMYLGDHDFKVVVCEKGSLTVCDSSDASFTITDLYPPITVRYPNGGEIFSEGQTVNVRWTGGRPEESIAIFLTKDGVWSDGDVALFIPNTGSYNWTINSNQLGISGGDDFQLNVIGFDWSDLLGDWSDDFFTINNIPSAIKGETNKLSVSKALNSCIPMSKDLKSGDKGQDVKNMQQAMKNIGFKMSVTGVYDSQTEKFVMALEKKLKLSNPNGKVFEGKVRKVISALNCAKQKALQQKTLPVKSPSLNKVTGVTSYLQNAKNLFVYTGAAFEALRNILLGDF